MGRVFSWRGLYMCAMSMRSWLASLFDVWRGGGLGSDESENRYNLAGTLLVLKQNLAGTLLVLKQNGWRKGHRKKMPFVRKPYRPYCLGAYSNLLGWYMKVFLLFWGICCCFLFYFSCLSYVGIFFTKERKKICLPAGPGECLDVKMSCEPLQAV